MRLAVEYASLPLALMCLPAAACSEQGFPHSVALADSSGLNISFQIPSNDSTLSAQCNGSKRGVCLFKLDHMGSIQTRQTRPGGAVQFTHVVRGDRLCAVDTPDGQCMWTPVENR